MTGGAGFLGDVRAGAIAGGRIGGVIGGLVTDDPSGAAVGGVIGAGVGGIGGAGWNIYKSVTASEQLKEGVQDKAREGCGKRTCDDDRYNELKDAKDRICGSIFSTQGLKSSSPKILSRVPCADIRRRPSDLRECRDARQRIQDECFKNSTDQKHKDQMDFVNNAIRKMEKLEASNCS